MANIKFSAFTQKVALGDVDFLVGYTGADNVRVAPSVLSSVYLPLAGGNMTGATTHSDNVNTYWGNSNDLQIYHDSPTNVNYINSRLNRMLTVTASVIKLKNEAGTETYLTGTENGAVDLYYDNSKKFETTSLGTLIPSGGFLSWGTDGVTAIAGSTATNHIGFFTDSAERMRIDSAGNVGIGTVTPQVTLDVDVGNADGMGVSFAGSIAIGEYQGVHFGYSENPNPNYRKSGIVFERTDASARGKIHILNNAQAGNNSAVLTDSRVTIQYDGNVGIGTTDPDTLLHVAPGADTDGIQVGGTTSNRLLISDREITLQRSNTSTIGLKLITKNDGSWGATGDAGDIVFEPNETEAMRLAVDGDATFAGNVNLPDSKNLKLGTGQDLELFHNATDSYIQNSTGHLSIINYADDKDIIFQCDDGAGGVEIYFYLDGSSGGSAPFTQFPDNSTISMGNGQDLRISHSGTQSKIENYGGTNSFEITQHVDDNDLDLRCDNGSGGSMTYLRLDGSIASMIGYTDLLFFDDLKLKFGDSQDLEIYHDASNSYIKDTGTGNLVIEATDFILKSSGTGSYIEAKSGVTELYHSNSKKFETTSTGTKTTGQMDLAALNTAPASASATGTLGEIRYTADYIYVCTATNTWKRTALSTW